MSVSEERTWKIVHFCDEMFRKIIYYLISCSLVIDDVINWEHTAPNDWMIVNKYQLEGMWKEASVVSLKVQSLHFSYETESSCLGRNSNRPLPEYK
jgi:hypothetical protein